MNGPSVSSQNASPSLSGRDAWKIALRGWAWGAGIGVGAGLIAALWSASTWHEVALLDLMIDWARMTGIITAMILPFLLAYLIEKTYRPRLGLEHLGLYLLATAPLPPMIGLLTWGQHYLGYSALWMTVASWGPLYTFYQRTTGITSGLYSRYHHIAPLISRRLDLKQGMLVAGYLSFFSCSIFLTIIFLPALFPWDYAAGKMQYESFGAAFTLMQCFVTAEAAATLRRHFPQESTWKLLVFFSFFVLAGGAILYWNDWVFFVKSKYLAMGYVPFALFWFATASTTGARRDAPVQGAPR